MIAVLIALVLLLIKAVIVVCVGAILKLAFGVFAIVCICALILTAIVVLAGGGLIAGLSASRDRSAENADHPISKTEEPDRDRSKDLKKYYKQLSWCYERAQYDSGLEHYFRKDAFLVIGLMLLFTDSIGNGIPEYRAAIIIYFTIKFLSSLVFLIIGIVKRNRICDLIGLACLLSMLSDAVIVTLKGAGIYDADQLASSYYIYGGAALLIFFYCVDRIISRKKGEKCIKIFKEYRDGMDEKYKGKIEEEYLDEINKKFEDDIRAYYSVKYTE